MKPTLYYIHDPMCSWCWAFRPVWQKIQQQLSSQVRVTYLLGGLAPDDDAPMPQQMQAYLQATWQAIQQRVPGTPFNFDFWDQCRPRRSTYPACRAVIAAREQGAEFAAPMIQAIQQAYYRAARNPSDEATLNSLAGEIGLDSVRFSSLLNATKTQHQLESEMAQARQMGVESFPSLVLSDGRKQRRIFHDYLDAEVVLEQIRQIVD